jgi:exodeoxyribonuclease VII small subunit
MAKTFEQNLKALEKIVEQLESGSISLDDAIVLFQKGKALSKECEARLREVELKIKQLVEDEQGQPTTVDFEPNLPEESGEGSEEE